MLSYVVPLVSNLLLWSWLAALLSLWLATRRCARARCWGTALLVGLWLLASRPVTELFVLPLEACYDRPPVEGLAARDLRQVVVLTGGGYPADDELLSSAFPSASSQRFLAGLELCVRLGPDCRMIFSGSAGRGRREITSADTMRQLALLLEPRRQAVAEALSGSTAEHPQNVRGLLLDDRFALVTSAYHMPRAMRSFRRAGLEPVAYPVEPLAHGAYGWTSWLPSVDNLRTLQIVWREYLALALYSLRGW